MAERISNYTIFGVKSIEFTTHIRKVIFKSCGYYKPLNWPCCEILGDSVADAVFDVQTFTVDDKLITKLIEGGFKPTTTSLRFVSDFD